MTRHSCYATSQLEKGEKCSEHSLNGKGKYCLCKLTGKIPNPDECGKSYSFSGNILFQSKEEDNHE
jgi:hypothetical protein